MEELQEADVLWPETPPPPAPPWGGREGYQPELYEATAALDFSCEPFGSEHATASSASSTSSSSSGRACSDGFLSDPSSFAGGHGGGDDASFQEADVLWPDDGYATRERGVVDGGELWWLCCGLGDAAAEPAAGGKRGSWRGTMVSSPIDIPTGVAARRRRPTAVPLVHRRSIGMDGFGLRQAHW